MATPPDDRLAPDVAVYVSAAGSGEIQVMRPSTTSATALQTVQTVVLGGAIMPMAWAPGHRLLYAVDRQAPFGVHTLSVDARTGLLTSLGRSPLAGNLAYVSVSRDGRTLLGASYGEDFIALHAIEANGIVGRALQALPTPRHAHCILPTPDGRHVWVACLGADQLRAHAWDDASGHPMNTALLASEPVYVHACRAPGTPPAGPRHLAFHPQRPWLFVINELDGTVDALAISHDPQAGGGAHPRLQALGRVCILPDHKRQLTPWSAELRLSADGQWLFASDRRAATLCAVHIDTHTGALRLSDCIDTEPLPRSFALAPDGRHVFVASQESGRLSIYGFDAAQGRLGLQSQLACGTQPKCSPTWVEAIALPAGISP